MRSPAALVILVQWKKTCTVSLAEQETSKLLKINNDLIQKEAGTKAELENEAANEQKRKQPDDNLKSQEEAEVSCRVNARAEESCSIMADAQSSTTDANSIASSEPKIPSSIVIEIVEQAVTAALEAIAKAISGMVLPREYLASEEEQSNE